jgi:hypothetical protein
MKIKFKVMGKNDREIKRFDTYEEAEAEIVEMVTNAADMLGTCEFYILKVWTNE